jgi:glycerol-3-phosphate cytidylyltransferase-like family protein
VSYKKIDTSAIVAASISGDTEALRQAKHLVAKQTVNGFEVGETTFKDLAMLLKGQYAYTPFVLKNGVRNKEAIQNETKWLVFDIDKSSITAEEAHFMLNDINHHISLGSNPNNEFKFRVLIELDSNVNLDQREWRYFLLAIADDLALDIDALPQSQIFYSYGHAKVLSVTDAKPLEVYKYITIAKDKAVATTTAKQPLTTKQQQLKLNDPLGTFAYCFECPLDSPGSRAMYRMMKEAKNDYNATKEQVIDLLNQVQEYWEQPLPEHRFNALLNQVERLYEN